jgi:hypothetical protein
MKERDRPRPEVPPISRGSPVREKDLTAGLGEAFSLDIPLHRSFFRSQIPESLKCGAFAGEVRLYTMHDIKINLKINGSVPIQADVTQLFLEKNV